MNAKNRFSSFSQVYLWQLVAYFAQSISFSDHDLQTFFSQAQPQVGQAVKKNRIAN